MRLLSFLKSPWYLLLFLGVSFLVFDLNWFFMVTFAGHRDNMCVMGANLTPLNIGFALIMSVLVGLLAVGLRAIFGGVALPEGAQSAHKEKRARVLAAHSFLGGLGTVFGFLTVFCTLCTLPVLSLFGLSVVLQLLVDYDPVVKAVSLVLLAAACWLLNRQLEKRCLICAP